MSKHVGVALALVLLVGVTLCAQICPTQSYLVTRGTAEAAQRAIVQTIDGAVRSLDVAVSSFADSAIGDAILRAAVRGVLVRVILPISAQADAGSQYQKLVASGIPVKLVPASRTFAHHFAVIDGASAITGTYEWAGGTNQTAYGTLTVIRCAAEATDRSTVDDFAFEFSRLWVSLAVAEAGARTSAPPPISMEITIQEIDLDEQCILLFNHSTAAADIGGWVITDSEGQYVFPDGTVLEAGEIYRLCIGAQNPVDVFLLYLDAAEDEVYLIAPDGTLVDQIVW